MAFWEKDSKEELKKAFEVKKDIDRKLAGKPREKKQPAGVAELVEMERKLASLQDQLDLVQVPTTEQFFQYCRDNSKINRDCAYFVKRYANERSTVSRLLDILRVMM